MSSSKSIDTKSQKPKSKLSWRNLPNWLIIITLIIFFPLGLIMVWLQARWSMRRRSLWTGVSSVAMVAWLVLLVSIAPPSATLTSSLAPVKASSIVLEGTVYPYDSEVTINGQAAMVSKGKFTYQLNLSEGDNEVTIVTQKDDKRSVEKIKIYRFTKSELLAQQKVESDKKAARAKADAEAAKKRQDQITAEKAKQDKLAADKAKADAEKQASEAKKKAQADAAAKAKAESDAAAKAAAAVTVSQRNALSKAKSYLSYSAFSRDGLVEQLEYEQFPHADAVYGADNSGANWNDQAAKKAKSYMSYSSFSRGGLIDQLVYEKFTLEQATHGANSVGL